MGCTGSFTRVARLLDEPWCALKLVAEVFNFESSCKTGNNWTVEEFFLSTRWLNSNQKTRPGAPAQLHPNLQWHFLLVNVRNLPPFWNGCSLRWQNAEWFLLPCCFLKDKRWPKIPFVNKSGKNPVFTRALFPVLPGLFVASEATAGCFSPKFSSLSCPWGTKQEWCNALEVS